MNRAKEYAGLDAFRLMAAVLVVAIHTSPLADFSVTADFVLTRIIARLAVPFFLMCSGFFLISRYSRNNERLWRFVKKTALIYAAAIVLYLPINIYNGYFGMKPLLPNILKDIVFDGTLYHLWYLPAAITGAMLAWLLVRRLGFKRALLITAALYLIGLFGDSYYGFAEKSAALKAVYGLLFELSDYTRNGIFFTPLFFVLGGLLADRREALGLKKSICGLALSFGLMLTEALWLHGLGVQRHDSMYALLPLCMYFLFSALLHIKGDRRPRLRTAALIVYIIHPMVIVAMRLFAKLLHMESLLIENSLVHFLAICAGSAVFAVIAALLWEKLWPWRAKDAPGTDRSYIEINLDNLRHNARQLKAAMPPACELMAVLKASAYGHGAYEVGAELEKQGVKAFAVACIDEGIELRRYGISGEILILGYTAPSRAKELKKYKLTQSLIDYEYAKALSAQGYDIKAHIKIDTGMHRLGFSAQEADKATEAFAMKHIHVTGMFTHLGAADSLSEEDVRFTKAQIDSFYALAAELQASGLKLPKLHIQSSYGLLNYPELCCDYVRAGIALYGVLSTPHDRTRLQLDLRPVLSLRSRVALIRDVKAGEGVGYNRAFVPERDSKIAVLPIGYADGYPRSLSGGKSYVLIEGQRALVVGKLCMDQMLVDVTDIPGVKPGTPVTLLGIDGKDELTAPMLAEQSQSISNELLSRLGGRLPLCKVS